MVVHLVDGTYELFRHFYGLRRFNQGVDRPFGAVIGRPDDRHCRCSRPVRPIWGWRPTT